MVTLVSTKIASREFKYWKLFRLLKVNVKKLVLHKLGRVYGRKEECDGGS